MTKLNFITSICGGGKSVKTISALAHIIELQKLAGEDLGLTIVASKTVALNEQNHSNFLIHTSQTVVIGSTTFNHQHVPSRRLDSATSSNVVGDINSLVQSGFKGVVFITHNALGKLSESILKQSTVFMDEIPQDLAGYTVFKHTNSVFTTDLNTWVEVVPVNGDFNKAVLKDSVDVEEVRKLIDQVQSGHNTMLSKEFAEIVDFLLRGYSVLYTQANLESGDSVQYFHAIKYHNLEKVLTNAKEVYVMAANMHDSEFGFIVETVLNIPVEQVQFNGEELPTKHNHKVTIIPFLKNGTWSGTMKNTTACDVLETDYQGTTATLMQEFSQKLLGNDFILFHNDSDVIAPVMNDTSILLSKTAVHGMNNMTQYKKAAFIASLRPSPAEEKVLRLFEREHTNTTTLMDRVVRGRCYEAAYQCCLRTGLRNANASGNFVLVVPDMAHAEYIAERFEAGCVTIDTTHSFESKASKAKAHAKDERLETAIKVLQMKKTKVAKMPVILDMCGISKRSFDNYKKEFKAELQALGLVK